MAIGPTQLAHDTVLERVISALQTVTSERDVAFSGGIRGDTRLVQDMDCDSTDLITLVMQLEVCFGRRDLSLDKLFMRGGSYRGDLCVGEIVSFLCEQLGKGGEPR